MQTRIVTMTLAVAMPLAVAAIAAPARAGDLCEVKKGEASISEEQARQKMAEAGYTNIAKVEMEHGCLEGKGMKDGKKIEVYVHPVTGAIVKVKEK